MSNGDDQQSFPPPPNTPPEDPTSRDDAQESVQAAEDGPTNPAQSSDGSERTSGSESDGAETAAGSGTETDGADAPEPAAPGHSGTTEAAPSVPSSSDQGPDSASHDQETVAMPAPTAGDAQPEDAPSAPTFGGQNQPSAPQYGGAPNQGGSENSGYPEPAGRPSPFQDQQQGQGLPPQGHPGQPGPGPQGQPGQQGPGRSDPYGQSQYPAAPSPNYSAAPYGSGPGANQPPQNPNPIPPQQPPYSGGPGGGPTGGPGSGPQGGPSGPGPTGSQAIPQPAPAPGFAGPAAATRADARPPKAKKKRLPLFIALGSVVLVLVLVAVGFFVIRTVNKNNYGPDKVAEDYVAALNKGDFAAAEKIAPSPRPEGTNVDLLAKDFTEGSSGKIENAKVESSTVDGDSGTVTVSYDLDGSQYNVDLPAKKDGRQDLFFDRWALTGPALHVISLDVPAADGMTINGKEYTAQAGTTAFAVYPGNYDFKLPASKWVSEAKDTAEVNFPQAFAPGEKPNTDQVAPITLNLSVSPTPAFDKEVQKQVETKLKDCFDTKSITPKCKFLKFDPREIPVSGSSKKLEDLAKKNSAKWTIKEMPKVKASFGAGDPGTGSFFTDKTGKFNFSVEGKKAGSSYFSNGNPLSVSGSVKIDGDKLKVEFFDF